MMHRFIVAIIGLILWACPLFVDAAEHFNGRGEYLMSDNESIKSAQDTALQEALRDISRQAAAVVKSRSVGANNQLTSDQIEMVTSTVVQVKEKKFQKSLETNGKIKIVALVEAELDAEQAEKMAKELMAARNVSNEYEKIRGEYSTKQSQYNALQGKYSEAVQKSAKYRTREGIRIEREGKTTEALKVYEEVIASDANYARAYSRRGHIYRQQGKNDLAQKDYDKAAALDPKEAGWHYGKAILLEQSGQKAAAAKEYRLFIEYADILEYDKEIPVVLDKILALEGNP